MFLLSLYGCGYKKAPYYLDETSHEDDIVKFIVIPSIENNETVDKK